MASPQAKLMKLMIRAALKHEPQSERKFVRRLRGVMNAPLVPTRASVGIKIHKSRRGGVSGHWIESTNPKATMLYLHGGAFIGGRLETYHPFCASLAQRLNARIFLPDYRLAPEHRFPAAVDDALNVYHHICAELKHEEHFVVAGDSAGGNLALGAMMAARDANLRKANCGILISPGVDVTGSLHSLRANSYSDCMLSAKMIDMAIGVYLAGADPRDPRASPGLGDFRGLPPMMVTVSEEECLRDDAYLVASKSRAAGGHVKLLSRPDMPHVWPVFCSYLPEARRDMMKICDFILESMDKSTLERQTESTESPAFSV